MAFWSGEKLLENKGVIIPFSDGQVDCNAYTLRMGNCYYRTADRETDPGYNGKLVYAVYNASPSPIQICENDKVFKIWFCDIDRVSEQFYKGNPFNDISNDIFKGMSKEIFSLQSVANKIRDLENTMNAKLAELKPTIDFLTHFYRAILIGIVLASLAFVFTIALKSWQEFVGWKWPQRPAIVSPAQPSQPPSP
jgi:hypothetical protein